MKRIVVAAVILAALPTLVCAEQARELTFFSNSSFSGARFTVTGARTTLDLPFAPKSAMLQGGGAWQVCAARDYRNPCQTIAASQRDLRLNMQRIGSVRPAAASTSPWREIARLDVRDRAEQDTATVRDNQPYREVMVCAERSTIRLRRAEVQFDNGRWQRLFLPLALAEGKCSKAIELEGGGRRIRALRFDYEAWKPGISRGTVVVRALPKVTPQSR